MLKSLLMASALTMAFSGAAMAQNQRFPPPGSTGPTYPDEDMGKLFASLPSDPVMSTSFISEAQLATAVSKSPQGISQIALVRGDPCIEAEMKEICNYAGAETIRKIRTFTWAASANCCLNGPQGGGERDNRIAGGGQSAVDSKMQIAGALLDYGIRQNLKRHYGEKGATDQQEVALNSGAGAVAKIGDSSTRSGFGCGQDEKDISFGLGSSAFFPKHRLTTCRAYFAKRLAWWVWSIEGAVEVSHSRFARKVLLWIPTGAETIAANSILAGSGNPQTNTDKYYSPISLKFKIVANSSPMSINANGSAASLGAGFNVSM